jgi:CheY-like chemotaxis protein
MPGKNILVVDDEPAIRATLRMALELDGYAVYEAANGEDALNQLRSIPRPALILLDLMMPAMDGWQFVEAAGRDANLAGIPVVVITAFANRGKPIRAQQLLEKPIDLATLFAVARAYCGGP